MLTSRVRSLLQSVADSSLRNLDSLRHASGKLPTAEVCVVVLTVGVCLCVCVCPVAVSLPLSLYHCLLSPRLCIEATPPPPPPPPPSQNQAAGGVVSIAVHLVC